MKRNRAVFLRAIYARRDYVICQSIKI